VSWRSRLAALLAGAAAVAGFSPLDVPAATLFALAVLVHLWMRADSPRTAFLDGYAFGLGFFLAGVSWIYVSLERFGGMPAPLAGIATLGFCAFLALFPAAAGWAQARTPRSNLRPLAIPAFWVLLEWLRGWILTGFPWLSLGYAAIDTPLAGYAPLGGSYLLSFLFMTAAGLLSMIAAGTWRFPAAAFALIGIGGVALQGIEWTAPEGAPVEVSLLQGNIPQQQKFDPARYERMLRTYAQLAEASKARLVVLPETALPRFLDLVDPRYLELLGEIARRNGGDLLIGAPRRTDPGAYYNSVLSLGTSPTGLYDKRHLVPLGEFIPDGLHWLVREVLNIPLSDFSRGADTQRPIAVAGQRVAVNICYENAFGAEVARMLPEATLLVNMSNVAWFGDSLAPGQHLQISRMRALETGRAHLMATNTGITAAIGADGAVLDRLPQFMAGELRVRAQGRSGATPYVKLLDWPVIALCAALVVFVALRGRSR
jgi:apolipoprotein N-acyltransferase